MTRGFIHFAHGRMLDGMRMNPASLLVFLFVAAQIPAAAARFVLGRSSQFAVAWARWNEVALIVLPIAGFYSVDHSDVDRSLHVSNSLQILGPRGNTLAVHAAGEGPTLFLLHGFPLDHRLWQHQLAGLCDRMHVVAIHLRGFGSSSLDESQFTLAELAQDVEFLRHHLAGNDRIWLAGLSLGGYVAFEYWRQFADHLRGLILTNTKPTGDSEEAKANRLAMADKALKSGSWAAVEPMLAKMLSEQTRASEPEVLDLV